jgi:thiaminase/DNA-binding XRE family transcriptional regulator
VDVSATCPTCERRLTLRPSDVVVEPDTSDTGVLWFACASGHVASMTAGRDVVDRLLVAGAGVAPSPAAHERRRLALASELRKLRRVADLTGTELGRQAGLTQSRISKIETGRLIPSPNAVARIAEAVGADDETRARLTEAAATLAAEAPTLRRLYASRATATSSALQLCESADNWLSQLKMHTVVRSIEVGTITADDFGRLMVQDWLFLFELMKVYAWLSARIPRVLPQAIQAKHAAHWRESLQYCIAATSRDGVPARIARDLQLSVGPNVDRLPACESYVTFLLQLTDEQRPADYAVVAAATLPCAWSYWELGRHLGSEHRNPHIRLWAEWINQDKAGSFYRTQCDLIDEATATTLVSAGDVSRAFYSALSFELGFWEVLQSAGAESDAQATDRGRSAAQSGWLLELH